MNQEQQLLTLDITVPRFSGSGIKNDVMGFILATAAMLELERSIPLDRDPHLKRKTNVTNQLADPTKIKQLDWYPKKYNRRL